MAAKKRSSTKTARATEANEEPVASQTGRRKSAEGDTNGKSTSTVPNANVPDAIAGLLDGEGARAIGELGDDLVSTKKAASAQAARLLDLLVEHKPEAVVPIIDRFVKAIAAADKRAAQTAANALPVMARVAPARVARHLQKLKDGFDPATPVGKDGLVRTFAALCTASVAYQKRLEPVLNKALGEADAKTLQKWTEVVLPALKGEPHARARATVEARLDRIPRAVAQKIADFLGIKLRLRYR